MPDTAEGEQYQEYEQHDITPEEMFNMFFGGLSL
jgi:hypothetical protein